MKRYATIAATASSALLAFAGAGALSAGDAPRGGADNANPNGAVLTVAAIEGWSGRADLANGNGATARVSSPFYTASELSNGNGARVFLGVIGPNEAPLVIEANSSGLKIR